MPARNGKSIWNGGWIGLILTVPMALALFAGYRRAGLPFLPFSLFDRLTRILPGSFLTAGIDSMVRTIRELHLGGTSTTAKLAEQGMAIGAFLLAGIIAGLLFFALARAIFGWFTVPAGLIVGGLLGYAALRATGQQSTILSAGSGASWIMLTFLVWGLLLGWACRRILRPGVTVVTEDAIGERVVERTGRRGFLARLTAASAVASAIGVLLARRAPKPGAANRVKEGAWSMTNPLPNAGAAVKPAPGTRPEITPVSRHYRIDIDTVPPAISEDTWRLKINGLVEKPIEWTLAGLRSRQSMDQFITLSCISNTVGGDLIGTTRWTGVSLKGLLPELGLQPKASHLKIRSADGFYEIVALDKIRNDERVMLAYAWDGQPLTAEHGFPLRIYIPDVYGMKQPKWIESIEVTGHWEPGYWVVRGWDREARMKATSVIDTISTNMKTGQAKPGMRMPIGGIAHAGVRGISKVEVQVDGGTWQAAELRPPLSGQTWVIWRYDWPVQKGKHKFTVRCFEGDGTPQIAEEAPPHPSGATGLDTRSMMI